MKLMKKSFIFLFILCLFSVLAVSISVKAAGSDVVQKIEGKTTYVAPHVAYGNANAAGTKEDPLNLVRVIEKAAAGDTIILLDGTYNLTQRIRLPEAQNGNFASYITVKAEHANKAILDFSSMDFDGNNRGIQLDGDYWYFYGIDVTGAGDNGMYIGGNNNIIEFCRFYKNRDSGLQLGRSDGSYTQIKDWPSNNLIKNCTSFDNYDDETFGENADGFAAKLTTGEGNVFDGCIAYRNCDDGWDLYAKPDSGVVGTTIIKNCIAFENGFTLTSHSQDPFDPTTPQIYTTRDGDGIGFKLGGSILEGSVIIENCVAFNNKLEGFADNSNPGVISMKNCTAYNNSVQVNANGTIGASDGLSINYDMARKNSNGSNSDSYNNYYGMLSYSTNETDPSVVYSLGDKFKGSMGYSIFAKYSPVTGSSKYYAFTSYFDANSYESDKAGTEYTRGLNDSMFAALSLPFDISSNPDVHTLLRNADGSINIGNMLKVVDPELLTFCEGNQIGANLSKTSWEAYDHYEFTTPELGTATEDMVRVIGAYDVLEVMCNPVAVFQDLKLLTLCNETKITWASSNTNVIKVTTEEEKSLSGVTNVWGKVYRDRSKDVKVTLTATITYGSAKMTKAFEVNVKKDNPSIGEVTGFEEKYILDQYAEWNLPEIAVSNKSSYSGLSLVEGVDYTVTPTYKYAQDKNATYYQVSDVYTSVPGVYEVTYNIQSLMNKDDFVTASFYVYVNSNYAEIDLNTGSQLGINVVSEGVKVRAELSAASGYMYVYTTDETIVRASAVKEKGQKFEIADESIEAIVTNANTAAYNIFVVFVNKADTYTSQVYSASVSIKTISTHDEFYNFATGGGSGTTIYQLQNDLDFSNYNWVESATTSTFGGLFDGRHHTISNITINGTSAKNVNVIYKVSGGSILNVKFHNITLIGDSNVSTRVAVIGQLCDGTIDNIELRNITAVGYQSAAGMVGHVVGGTNYISRVSLVNDENQRIEVSGKYCGGIVGNVQKDTTEKYVECYIDNCYVNGVIGGTTDTGGYTGGIVGRYKNEFEDCVLSIEQCVVYGQIRTGKNYAGGITGGCDNGSGYTRIYRCLADVTLYYVDKVIDGKEAVAVKNGSPIMGRQTVGLGVFDYMANYGSFADYNAGVSDSEDFEWNIKRDRFWTVNLRFDIENTWSVDLTTGKAVLIYQE